MEKLNKLIIKSKETTNLSEAFDENIRLKFTAKKIAFKIFFELKRNNMNQQDLAGLLNVSPQNISKLLKGDDYKLSTLVKIEDALSINLIDRDIYSNKNNISVFVDYKSFEQKRTPIIVGEQSFFIKESFKSSNHILEKNLFKRSINFEQSIKEIFQNEI